MGSEGSQPFCHLRTQGEGTMCELWRGLTRHVICCVLILDVRPAGSEDSARGPAVTGAQTLLSGERGSAVRSYAEPGELRLI